MVRRIVPILGSILCAAACSAETVTAGAINIDDHISLACQARGGSAVACECVSREAHLRFTETEIEIIVGPVGEEFASRVEASGLSRSHQTSLIRRAHNADIVIRQSCSVSLLNRPINSGGTPE